MQTNINKRRKWITQRQQNKDTNKDRHLQNHNDNLHVCQNCGRNNHITMPYHKVRYLVEYIILANGKSVQWDKFETHFNIDLHDATYIPFHMK
jgi:hypothetical protein